METVPAKALIDVPAGVETRAEVKPVAATEATATQADQGSGTPAETAGQPAAAAPAEAAPAAAEHALAAGTTAEAEVAAEPTETAVTAEEPVATKEPAVQPAPANAAIAEPATATGATAATEETADAPEPVTPQASTAAAEVQATPAAKPADLNTVIEAAGLQLVETRAAPAAASAAPAVRLGRPRKTAPAAEQAPLEQVETQNP